MSRLVIHPRDDSTAFLSKVYENLDDATVITGGVSQADLKEMMLEHDQILMMGHGTEWGLLGVDQFNGWQLHIIDDSFAPILRQKENTAYIWCNADQYVTHNELNGFNTGMYISEVFEAYMMGLDDTTQREVDESNDAFVEAVAAFAGRGPRLMHAAAKHRYGKLMWRNPVAKYNHERLYIN